MGEFFGFGEDLEHKHPPKPQANQPGDQEAKSTRQPQFCPGDLLSIGLKVSKVSFACTDEANFDLIFALLRIGTHHQVINIKGIIKGIITFINQVIIKGIFKGIFKGILKGILKGIFGRIFNGIFKSIFEGIHQGITKGFFKGIFESILKGINSISLWVIDAGGRNAPPRFEATIHSNQLRELAWGIVYSGSRFPFLAAALNPKSREEVQSHPKVQPGCFSYCVRGGKERLTLVCLVWRARGHFRFELCRS